jgi:two-component system sensor histidine kinase/response regulator
MDGYTAVSELRRREARFDDGRHTTVVAVTAHAMEEDRKLALASGMDDYISKPFELADLATLLGAWVGELPRPFSSKPSAAQHAAAAPSHAAPLQVRDAIRSVELFDPSALDKLRQLDGGGDLVSQVVEVFLGELPTRRDAVRVALAQGDVGAAGRAAHALRSGALAVGATGLADACARLELLARSGDLATARALGIELEEFCKNAASLVRRGASRAPGR